MLDTSRNLSDTFYWLIQLWIANFKASIMIQLIFTKTIQRRISNLVSHCWSSLFNLFSSEIGKDKFHYSVLHYYITWWNFVLQKTIRQCINKFVIQHCRKLFIYCWSIFLNLLNYVLCNIKFTPIIRQVHKNNIFWKIIQQWVHMSLSLFICTLWNLLE